MDFEKADIDCWADIDNLTALVEAQRKTSEEFTKSFAF